MKYRMWILMVRFAIQRKFEVKVWNLSAVVRFQSTSNGDNESLSIMVLIVKKLLQSYNYYFHVVKGWFIINEIEKLCNLRHHSLDPRSKDFFLLQSPIIMTMLLTGYLLMIKHGPKLMENRKAFELKTVLMVYNFVQVVLNLILGTYVIDYS